MQQRNTVTALLLLAITGPVGAAPQPLPELLSTASFEALRLQRESPAMSLRPSVAESTIDVQHAQIPQIEASVPEDIPMPASLWALGSAILGFTAIGRRRQHAPLAMPAES